MYATFKFDTEDVYFPPEYRIDDIPGWLAEIMTAHGIRGTFCVFGEKARSMKDRGREDVLTAMLDHDLVSHQQGNVRPLIPEVLEDKGWTDGVEAMRAYEDKVTEDFQHAFGRAPVGLSRHNLYWAPQHVAVGGERGQAYMSGIVGVENCNQPNWYAGTLILPSVSTLGFGGFDSIYSNDAAFERRFRQLDPFIADCAERGAEYVSLFACHPVQVMAHGWVEEYCLVSGLTRTPEELGWLYAVRTPEQEARAKVNFARLVKCIKEHPDIEVVGLSEAAAAFSTQPADIRRDELIAYAEQVGQAGKPLQHSIFSPAELMCGFAESLVHAGEHGDVPYAVDRRNVLGPRSRPVVAVEIGAVTQDELVGLCRQVVESVASEGHLPANVQTSGARVGLGQLLIVAARSYLALARYEKYEKLKVERTPRYPDAAMKVDAWVQTSLGEHWPYALDFSCEKIAEHARLQTWTLKPAWLNPPRGRIRSENRIQI